MTTPFRAIALLPIASAALLACGDDSSAADARGSGGSGGSAATSTTSASSSVSSVDATSTDGSTSGGTETSTSTEGPGSGGGGAGGSGTSGGGTGGSATGTGGGSGTGTGGGTSAYDAACQALADAMNAQLDASCLQMTADDACELWDRPGCEDEAAATVSCVVHDEIVCSCDETQSGCEIISGDRCDVAWDAYDACEGSCPQQGGGTYEEAAAAFDPYCAALGTVAADAGCAEPVDCASLSDVYLAGMEGCEAEMTTALECLASAYAEVDGARCSCDGTLPSCPALADDPCAAEMEAFEDCSACD